ncbi:MAG: MFS transporter, partial [Fervidicoccaceae archaeon]
MTKLRNPFDELNRTGLTRGHLKLLIVSGFGFFTDAYDLFVIGVVLLILSSDASTSFHLAGNEVGLIGASSLASAILGQLLFGKIADVYGRKKVYGTELAILIAGAIMSALSWNFSSLLISRIILGIGIGGDYPVSATIMSEYSNARDRGKLVGLVFSMQGLGAISAVLAAYFLASKLPAEIAWRALLGIGAIPPSCVVFLRRKIRETPRFSLFVAGNEKEASEALRIVLGEKVSKQIEGVRGRGSAFSFNEFLREYRKPLIITSLSWFLMDI